MQICGMNDITIARHLLQTEAVRLRPDEPFTWASGLKSPIYCDNRVLLSHNTARNDVKNMLAELIKTHFPEATAIVGVATAGIAPGVLAADVLGIPFGYVRSEAKKHGMGKQIEGDIKPNEKIVVVEDLVSTGKSSLEAIQIVRAAGFEVLGLAAIFTYGFPLAAQNFEKQNCPMYTLSNYHILIEEALQMGYVQQNQMEMLSKWREKPEEFGV